MQRKHLVETQHPFTVKKKKIQANVVKKGHSSTRSRHFKSWHHSEWGNVEAFPPRFRTRQGCSLSPLLFNTEISHKGIRQANEMKSQKIKRIQIEKEEVKVSLFPKRDYSNSVKS